MAKNLTIVILLLLLCIGSVSAALTDGLKSYWKLDEASGTLYDSLKYINLTATNTPLYSQTGVIETAIAFNSNGDFFSSTTNASSYLSFGTTQDFTLNFWVYLTGNTGAYAKFVMSDNANSGNNIGGIGIPIPILGLGVLGVGNLILGVLNASACFCINCCFSFCLCINCCFCF